MKLDCTKQYLVFIDRNIKSSWKFYEPLINQNNKKDLNLITISEYRGSDFYIDLKGEDWTKQGQEFWNFYRGLDLHEMIDRCRVLRALQTEFARELIRKAVSYFFNFFRKNKIDSIICFAVDRYSLDTMFRVAQYFSIEIIGIGGSFIKGTKRLTLYGERQYVHSVGDELVTSIFNSLKVTHPAVGRPSKFTAIYLYLKNSASIIVRYFLNYLIYHKIFGLINFDYLLVKTQLSTVSLRFNQGRFFDFKNINSESVKLNSISVYIPLHYHPEATVDYWTDSPDKAYYLESLCEVISYYQEKGVSVFLKEHPAMYLVRSPNFYKTLKSYKNVSLIWPFVDTLDILKVIDKVVIWTGTSGIEAAVNGNEVYLYSLNYWDCGLLKSWKQIDLEGRLTEKESKQIIQAFLENLVYAQ